MCLGLCARVWPSRSAFDRSFCFSGAGQSWLFAPLVGTAEQNLGERQERDSACPHELLMKIDLTTVKK